MPTEDEKGQLAPRQTGTTLHLLKTQSTRPENTDGGRDHDKMERGEGQEATTLNTERRTPWIQSDGESGRRGFHPWHSLRICWASSSHVSKWTNVLWPFTIAAIVLYFCYDNIHLWIFITAYIGIVPAANLLGFGGQELARKIPKVLAIILETTFGSITEIILFMGLVSGGNNNVPVIQAAILGSILANLLLCLGAFRTSNLVSTLFDMPNRFLFLRWRYIAFAADLPQSYQRSGL